MKKEQLLPSAHIIAGVITILIGFDAFELKEFLLAGFFLFLALVFILVAAIHPWMTKKFIKADVAFFLLEATTIIYSSWHFKLKGDTFMFVATAFVGAIYFVFSILSLLTQEKSRHHSRRRKRKHSSSSMKTERLFDNSSGESGKL